MGVLNCSRLGCENIMCDTYVPKIGHICNALEEDFGELKTFDNLEFEKKNSNTIAYVHFDSCNCSVIKELGDWFTFYIQDRTGGYGMYDIFPSPYKTKVQITTIMANLQNEKRLKELGLKF